MRLKPLVKVIDLLNVELKYMEWNGHCQAFRGEGEVFCGLVLFLNHDKAIVLPIYGVCLN